MSWIAVATTVVGLLAPYASKAGEEVSKKIGAEIFTRLKARFQKEQDEDAKEVLENYVRKPHIYEETLGKVLAHKAEAQPDEFGALLKELASQAGEQGSSGGQTAIGRNIAQADRGSTASVTIQSNDSAQ